MKKNKKAEKTGGDVISGRGCFGRRELLVMRLGRIINERFRPFLMVFYPSRQKMTV